MIEHYMCENICARHEVPAMDYDACPYCRIEQLEADLKHLIRLIRSFKATPSRLTAEEVATLNTHHNKKYGSDVECDGRCALHECVCPVNDDE